MHVGHRSELCSSGVCLQSLLCLVFRCLRPRSFLAMVGVESASAVGELVVRNTFLAVVDASPARIRRCYSQGDLPKLEPFIDAQSQPSEAADCGPPPGGSDQSDTTASPVDLLSDSAGSRKEPLTPEPSSDAHAARQHSDSLPSVGSAQHSAGRCTPCKFFSRLSGCNSGADCAFCHISHKKSRMRPSKNVRKACKALVGEGRAAEASFANSDTGAFYLQTLLRHRVAS